MQRTSFLKKVNSDKKWNLIDASNLIVGRLAVEIVKIITGKNMVHYASHVNFGNNVVVINVEKVFFTGRKKSHKVYFKHTGYIGGLKSTNPAAIFNSKFPDRILRLAVQRMLKKGPLARQCLQNLYIYNGADHPHAGQQPELLDLPSLCSKNSIHRSLRV